MELLARNLEKKIKVPALPYMPFIRISSRCVTELNNNKKKKTKKKIGGRMFMTQKEERPKIRNTF